MRRPLVCLLVPVALLAVSCDSDSAPSSISSSQITTGDTTAESGSDDTVGPATTDVPSDTDGDGTADSDTTVDTATTGEPGTIDWQEIDEDIEQGFLEVPVDYEDPSQGTFTLNMVRHLAEKPSQRIGTLLVNPGGPGSGGTFLAEQAAFIYGQDVLDRFDILGWDPRGTGSTQPAIDCISDYDHFYNSLDITPDDQEERDAIIDLAKEFAQDCESKNEDILEYVGTNNSARDMDQIRQALGEQTISYFGFSYGSELGATWATLFPDTVRAAVLDGASDPDAPRLQSGLDQAKGFEDAIDTFLAQCSADRTCAFHNDGDAEGAFDELMAKIDEDPIDTEEGRPPLTRGAAITAVGEAMYDSTRWPDLADALTEAQQGDGAALLAFYDSYYQRLPDGSYSNLLEAFSVISCMDEAERTTVAEEDAEAPQFTEVAPRFAPNTTGAYGCTFFPESIDPRVTVTGKGAGPILVMGTTGDPATPLASTRKMAAALEDGRLVVVTADQHTGYGVNECSISTVDEYLIDPEDNAPESGTECP